jgi:carboxypeptidase Taq
MNTPQLYELYKTKMQRIADIRNASALMQWDQETYMPPRGAALRGQQISTLSELSHKLFIEEELGSILNDLSGKNDLDSIQKRNVERTLDDYKKNKKYTSAFVRALSDQVNKSFHAWIEARKHNQFSIFQPELDKLITLKKQETQLLGFEKHPYDALLDEFEKECTVELLDKTFSGIIPVLKILLGKIAANPQVDASFLHQVFPKEKQWEWGMYLVRQLNFDFESGRQDISEHPFSTSFNSKDVRITTRMDENDFANMTWSCIHETGHALYEQGLLNENYGLPLGEACSYSIHESQSRLWENNVGRSFVFWRHYYPELQQYFPEQFKNVSADQFYKGINKVQPSFIRTEADEITYHFHVYIRYELEKKLIEGSLSSQDIPAYWNEQYKQLMDITVPDDKNGCLQDVHWSHGSFGYFPTYSLGSFYAAQFFNQAEKEMPLLESGLEKGDTSLLLKWLREKIHSKGRFYTSEELCKAVTGTGLEINSFTSYLLDKYSSIYTL